jgi:hypothetical protein
MNRRGVLGVFAIAVLGAQPEANYGNGRRIYPGPKARTVAVYVCEVSLRRISARSLTASVIPCMFKDSASASADRLSLPKTRSVRIGGVTRQGWDVQ